MKHVAIDITSNGDVTLVVNGRSWYKHVKVDVNDKDALRNAVLSMIDDAHAKLTQKRSNFHMDVT